MEHNRKQKLLMIIALIAGIASLSIGFAAFSVSLNISSSASVSPSSDTFSVKFSTSQNSLAVAAVAPSSKTSGITTTDGVIDNGTNPTIKNLSATFTTPGQYVEYTFYARNEGEYTAYLNNINFLGDKTCTGETGTTTSLVTSACESINISATIGNTTYTETTPIEGHTLAKGVGEQIKIRLEYLSSGTAVDGAFSIKFPNVALVYSTIDDSSIEPTLPTIVARLVSGNLNEPGSIVSIGDEQFYVFGQEDGNVKLLSMYNLHVGNIVDIKWHTTPLGNPTGIQNEDAIGYNWDSVNEVEIFPFIGTTAFSSDSQTGTNYSDYNGSIVEGYVNNYSSYLAGLGANIEEARLITKEELETLGCSSDNSTCSGAPEFVYKTSYWSGSAIDIYDVWIVNRFGNFVNYYCCNDNALGVRPVIEIALSEF